jgi:hypothetical protein
MSFCTSALRLAVLFDGDGVALADGAGAFELPPDLCARAAFAVWRDLAAGAALEFRTLLLLLGESGNISCADPSARILAVFSVW